MCKGCFRYEEVDELNDDGYKMKRVFNESLTFIEWAFEDLKKLTVWY